MWLQENCKYPLIYSKMLMKCLNKRTELELIPHACPNEFGGNWKYGVLETLIGQRF